MHSVAQVGLLLSAVSQELKPGDRGPHITILLKYIYDLLHDPVFSPNITTAQITKVGSLTKSTFCMAEIILVIPIGFPCIPLADHFENVCFSTGSSFKQKKRPALSYSHSQVNKTFSISQVLQGQNTNQDALTSVTKSGFHRNAYSFK